MTGSVFADSFYFIALLSPRDHAHDKAIELGRRVSGQFVTTDAVLLEVADALCAPRDRRATATYLRSIWHHHRMKVYPLDRSLVERGMAFYEARADKEWSLTDCISFVVMREEGIEEALTADTHYAQAGFRILL
jgi:predicted nucleic acid-binding protein